MEERNLKSYLMLVTAMLIFGTIGIFRRYIPLSSGMLAFSRGLLGSLFLWIILRVRRQKGAVRPEKKTLLLLALTGALIGANWILLFEAYNYTTIATATMCYYMEPTLVILLSPFIFREKLTPRRLLCAAAAILGMVFISGMMEGGGIRPQDLIGVLCGLGAAMFYATVVMLNKKIALDDAYEKTAIHLAAATLTLVPYLLLTEDFSAIRPDARAIVMVLIVGVVHTGFAYALYFGSMNRLKAQSIAVLSYIDPVFALLLSAAVLHERLSVFGAIGAVLIIGSALISELLPGEKSANT